MKKSHVDVIFDRRKTVAKCGKGLAEYRLYLSRNVRKYIPIAEITPEQLAILKENIAIQEQLEKYDHMLSAIEFLGKPLTYESLNEAMGKEEKKEQPSNPNIAEAQSAKSKDSFILFFYDQLASEHIERRTTQAREVVYRSLLAFGRIKKFEDLTPANILEYHKWLQKDGNRKATTLKHYHKRLHRYVLKAFEYGYIERDPYKQVTIPTGQYKERKPLTETELDLLLSLHLPPKEAKARDLFIFSAYTGLSYCDAQALDFHTMAEKHGDLWYIDGSRIKSGTTFYTPILPRAFAVLEKYNFRLPRMSNQKLNDYLHLVESRASLHKNLTSHLARHTFATMVLAQDVPVEDLARMLGHKDVRTTQHYAKILKTTIHRHAEDLIRKLRK